MADAYADPTTTCWQCHRTLPNCKPHANGKPATWTAGHVIDGQPDHTLTLDGLTAECSVCNYSRGASWGNRHRTEPCSADWR